MSYSGAIIKKDGAFYLAQKVCGENEGWSDFETVIVEITPERIKDWRSKLDLAERLKSEHGIDAIQFTDYSARYYQSDCDDEWLDEDEITFPPLWEKGPARTDADMLRVQAGGYLFWAAYPHYSDYPKEFTSYGLNRKDLGELEKQLTELMANEKLHRPAAVS